MFKKYLLSVNTNILFYIYSTKWHSKIFVNLHSFLGKFEILKQCITNICTEATIGCEYWFLHDKYRAPYGK